MNQEKNRNFKKKQVDSKKRRPYYQKQNQDKSHYKQKYVKKKNPNYFYQKKEKEADNYVYKQDLIQMGFQASEKTESQYQQLTEKYPAIFNSQKRKVIIQKRKKTDVQKVDNIEEIKKDFKKLIENEDIPDWFLEEEQQEVQEDTFDFGDTVQRTVSFQKDLERVHEEQGPLQSNLEIIGGNFDENDEDFSDLKDMDFAQLDAYLEKKAQKQQIDDDPVPEQNSSVSSNEHSGDYFDNLEKNIKNMLESSKEDFEDDSEESFAEQLGFNYESDMNKNPNVLPLTKNQQPQIVIEDQQQDQPIPQEEKQDEEIKEEKQDDSEKKQTVSPEELQMRKKFFMQKYGYLDQILCQLVYEILNSRKNLMLNKLSANGFNQESVEKYCQNDYKIFSMYTQGNILPKIWYYKDEDQKIQGPFMSYDMDIWNGEEGYFSSKVEVSVSGENYLPIELYLNRDPQVIQIVEDVLNKLNKAQESATQQKMKHQQKRQYRRNNNTRQQNTDQKGNENEEFPALGKAPKQKSSHGQSLISTLTQKTEQKVEPQKSTEEVEKKEIKQETSQPKIQEEVKVEKQVSNENVETKNQQKVITEDSKKEDQNVNNLVVEKNDQKQIKERSANKKQKDSKRGNQKGNKNYRKKDKKKQSQREQEQIYYKKKNSSPKKKLSEKNEELTNDLKNLLGL